MTDSLLGRLFAVADFREQADFLNHAGRTLRRVCESETYADIQLSRIVDCLDGDGRTIVKKLAAMIDSDETAPSRSSPANQHGARS